MESEKIEKQGKAEREKRSQLREPRRQGLGPGENTEASLGTNLHQR